MEKIKLELPTCCKQANPQDCVETRACQKSCKIMKRVSFFVKRRWQRSFLTRWRGREREIDVYERKEKDKESERDLIAKKISEKKERRYSSLAFRKYRLGVFPYPSRATAATSSELNGDDSDLSRGLGPRSSWNVLHSHLYAVIGQTHYLPFNQEITITIFRCDYASVRSSLGPSVPRYFQMTNTAVLKVKRHQMTS